MFTCTFEYIGVDGPGDKRDTGGGPSRLTMTMSASPPAFPPAGRPPTWAPWMWRSGSPPRRSGRAEPYVWGGAVRGSRCMTTSGWGRRAGGQGAVWAPGTPGCRPATASPPVGGTRGTADTPSYRGQSASNRRSHASAETNWTVSSCLSRNLFVQNKAHFFSCQLLYPCISALSLTSISGCLGTSLISEYLSPGVGLPGSEDQSYRPNNLPPIIFIS